MKKIVLLFVLTTVLGYSVKAQTTAMDFNKNNCNGTNSHLFEDLDNGQAVVLFYYMPNCGSCPPPAKKIQAMLSNLNVNYPGKVKGYAIPYNNTTKCPNVQTWVTGNSLSLFTPLDSGATQVAYYGGFGMPTVVLVGGSDHRVLFNTQNFTTADTTVMRDSIINLFQGPSAVKQHAAQLQEVNIYPNPVSHELSVEISLNSDTYLKIDIQDLQGKLVQAVFNDRISAGKLNRKVDTSALPTGNYLLKMESDGVSQTRQFSVSH